MAGPNVALKEWARPWRDRALTESGSILLAASCAAGALWARPGPWLVPAAVLVVAVVARRPWLVIIAAALLTSTLAARAIEGAKPAAPEAFRGVVTLATDPVVERGGQRAEVRLDNGRRLEVHARGRLGGQLGLRLAGERIAVDGQIEPRPDGATWLLRRHIVGRLDTESISLISDGDPASRAANAFRRMLLRGAASLPDDERALFTGFVFGDDRAERPDVIDDFRSAGLSHLLAVSGENVAFVLIAAGPLLRRLELPSRFVVSVGLLLFFAFATRMEPSVLRATAMALIAVVATTTGRPISGLRTLALAVSALLIIDPFLVGSVGFQLSVAASAGIIVGSARIADRLPGPRVVRELTAVTLAAQIGVAPVLLGVFGSMPVTTLPANMAAVPAAGPVMVWGLTGGIVAAIAPAPIGVVIHLPTHALLWWVKTVARLAAGVPLGEMSAGHVALALAFGALLLSGVTAHHHHHRRRVIRWMAFAGLLGLAVHLVMIRPVATGPEVALGRGAVLFNGPRGEAVLVFDGSARDSEILRGLRANGVRRLDAVVARSAGRGVQAMLAILDDRMAPPVVLRPDRELTAGSVYPVGALEIVIEEAEPRLTVTVRENAVLGVGSARGPPRR